MSASGSAAHAVRRLADAVDRVATICSAAGFLLILVLTVVQVLSRLVIPGGVAGVVDLTAHLLMPLAVLFAITVTDRRRQHVRIVMLHERFGANGQHRLNLFVRVCSVIFTLLLAGAAFIALADVVARGGTTSGDVHLPLALVLAIPLAAFLVYLVHLFSARVTETSGTPARERSS